MSLRLCHGDKRRNNPKFSQSSCIDEGSKTEERREELIVQCGHLYSRFSLGLFGLFDFP
jgi:hypothetical protein